MTTRPPVDDEQFTLAVLEHYDRVLAPLYEPDRIGEFISLDAVSLDHEIDPDSIVARKRLKSRRPNGEFVSLEVGRPVIKGLDQPPVTQGARIKPYVPASVGQGARTLEGRAYTSKEVFRNEHERIFEGGWVSAGRSEALANVGDFLTLDVGRENLLLVRGDDGIRAFYNFCRHRGARLVTEEAGDRADCLRCPYHGWNYALDGRLTAARHMRDVPDFRLEDYPLVPTALREWEGFLWVNLAEEPEPFEQAFAPVLDRFHRWYIGELKRGHRVEYDVQANWKLIVENYSECYHCNLIHPELVVFSPADSGRNDLTEGAFLGGYMDLNDRCDTMSLSGMSSRPPIGGVDGDDLSRVYYYALFPNLLLSLHPDYVMAHFLHPEAADRTRITCEFYFDPDTMARPDFDPSDAVDFWDRVNRQDWAINERVQLGIRSKAYTPGPYANQEGLLWAFDHEYLRRMA